MSFIYLVLGEFPRTAPNWIVSGVGRPVQGEPYDHGDDEDGVDVIAITVSVVITFPFYGLLLLQLVVPVGGRHSVACTANYTTSDEEQDAPRL